jgi:hypothetical protein
MEMAMPRMFWFVNRGGVWLEMRLRSLDSRSLYTDMNKECFLSLRVAVPSWVEDHAIEMLEGLF